MPKIAGSPFGALLRQYRRTSNLTQEGLAELARISARSVSDLERGLSRMPHPDTILALAQVLSLSDAQRIEFLAAARSRPDETVVSPMELPPLPVELSPIVAREREEAALFHLLQRDTTRFLTLTGPGGVGKTRLALQIAHTAQEYFTDGVVFIFLEAIREPQLVLSTIAQALKLQEKRQKDAFQTLITALRDRHLLLVLDNCEQVLEAAESLLKLLTHCPSLKILTTSRARWRVRGEQVFSLMPLAVPTLPFSGPPEQCEQYGAVSLFLQYVRAMQPDFHLTSIQVAVVAELCTRLDGLPLAIELAASRFPLFSAPQLLERMSKTGPGVLQMLTSRLSNGPKRHRSLRTAMDWSYELLNEAEQHLFRSLCVFEGSISLEALLAICVQHGEEETVLLESFETLLAQSLVHRLVQDETRFRVLETVRAYGLEQLAASGEEPKLYAAYASYMLTLAKREVQRLNGAEYMQALAQLGKEMDHFRAVLRWLQDHHELEQSLQLAGELWRYWFLQRALSEGRNWFDRLFAQEAEKHGVQILTLGRACYGAGVLAAEQGDYKHAIDLGERASSAAAQLGEHLLQAQALTLQGNIARYQGNFALAAQRFEQSLVLFRSLDHTTNVAVCLNNLAILAQKRGDYNQAYRLQEESLAIKRSQGNQRGIAVAFMNLGDIARDEGQLADAQRWAEESLHLFQQLSDEKGCAVALNNLGEIACLQGDYELAETYLADSLKRSREIGDNWEVAVTFHSTARLAQARGERDKARSFYLQSLQLYMEEESQIGMIECLEGLLALVISSEPQVSAHLAGLTSRWRSQTETPLPPIDAPVFTRACASLQTALGEKRFAQLFSEGEAASLVDEAFTLSEQSS